MKLRLDLNSEKCSDCGACAIACMDQWDIDIKKGESPLRVLIALEKNCNTEDGKTMKCGGCVERVRHGLKPACVRTCPTEALTLTETLTGP